MTKFVKTAKQIALTQLHVDYMFVMAYGGSRSGKTFITLRNILIRACKVKSRHLVVRFRFNHVKQSVIYDTLPKVLELCFPGLPKLNSTLNKSDWFLKLPNGSEIWFGGLDDKDRIDKVLGNEYSTIFVNESTQITWVGINTLMSRLAEKTTLKNKMWFDCNPVGQHHWTYMVFEKGLDPETKEIIANNELYKSIQLNPIDNLDNLPDEYIKILESLPKRQRKRFLDGLYLKDVEGALWTDAMISEAKAKPCGVIIRTVIAVDPAVTNNPDSAATGIIICSLDESQEGIVQKDLSIKASTKTWAQRAVNAYYEFEANAIVAEVNQGGDLVEDAIHNIDRNVKVVKVRASKGKFARAEPVSALYETNEHSKCAVTHLEEMPELEAELTEWVPANTNKSPDRLDALVWGLTYLMVKKQTRIHVGKR